MSAFGNTVMLKFSEVLLVQGVMPWDFCLELSTLFVCWGTERSVGLTMLAMDLQVT